MSNNDDITDKIENLESFRSNSDQKILTTNQGLSIVDNQNTLKAGSRGASLLEDFIMREKITHFDHERIPERVVHARGEAAHGYFQVYESMTQYTKAAFLKDPTIKTPVFVRFSTVAGSRGSADTVRDVRGFAVKFYTSEGNFDLVGNNIPVFFIQDAIKFPDLIHAVKPEPHNEIPQAASAHNTFWDFVSTMPETMHMIMWIMSDRAIPRSLRMMEGFGVHTFRFINAQGLAHFVKFHWKPLLGVHSLVWEEAQILAGKDPDFHRRDLWQAIEDGDFPEWEFGVQIIPEENEFNFDFDLLDATKLVPEEIVPVQRIGKLVLNRNPDNFFAETEQVAFHPGHIVPGIDFTNDPLLQGRLFSYTDTQLSRLGGPNFHEIPINRPICPFHNNQRDGMHRQTINIGQVAYEPNQLAQGYPHEADSDQGFTTYPEKVAGSKIRIRSESFKDHFSQATLFWNSQSEVEKNHIIAALQFELAKVEIPIIRERIVMLLAKVDQGLAQRTAQGLGITIEIPYSQQTSPTSLSSPALSMTTTIKDTIKTRQVAFIVAEGVDDSSIDLLQSALISNGAKVKILANTLGKITTSSGKFLAIDHSIVTMPSVSFDAVFIPGGIENIKVLKSCHHTINFIKDAYYHYKTIAVTNEASDLLSTCAIDLPNLGIITLTDVNATDDFVAKFIAAIKQHRHWQRSL